LGEGVQVIWRLSAFFGQFLVIFIILIALHYFVDNSLPSVADIRDRLNRVGSAFFPPADTRAAKNVDEYQSQCALKYQYIIAGKSNDVSGKYQAKKGLVYALDVDGVDSLCFPVHTSMNKSGPTIRGPTIPYNRKFEP
jgi:hypothetical protein